MAKAVAANTGRKDAKNRVVYKGPRGGEFVLTSSGRKAKPAVGRLSKKQLEAKAKNLSAKRVGLEETAKHLSAKRQQLERGAQFLDQEAARLQAENTMKKLNSIASKKAANVKKAVRDI
jgi:hypothetical protein